MLETGKIAEKGTMKAKVKAEKMDWWIEIFQVQDDKKKPEIEYSTGEGTHICHFRGHTIFAE
jgi:hypothetical protein